MRPNTSAALPELTDIAAAMPRRRRARRFHTAEITSISAQRRYHDLVESRLARLVLQEAHALGDLERIASVRAEHLVHVGDQRMRLQAARPPGRLE